jgi:hypothetical protein
MFVPAGLADIQIDAGCGMTTANTPGFANLPKLYRMHGPNGPWAPVWAQLVQAGALDQRILDKAEVAIEEWFAVPEAVAIGMMSVAVSGTTS